MEVVETPVPIPGPGQVRVRLRARPINPSDLLYIEGRYGRSAERFPAVPGFEGAGTVEAVGEGSSLRCGTKVAMATAAAGTWQDRVVADADEVMALPEALPESTGCQVSINPFTALLLLRTCDPAPGDWIVQSAASSAVGKMLLFLARRSGLRCACVARDPHRCEELARLGADAVIDSAREPVEDRIREHTDGAAVALDAVGGEIGTDLLRSLRDGGRFISYGMLSGKPVEAQPHDLVFRDITLEGFWLPPVWARVPVAERQRLAERVLELVSEPGFVPTASAEFDLSDVRDAIHRARSRHAGKVLLNG
ncbi:hypothetical protein IL38_12075 [Actinopolyspora erythraea]|uniref:Enoyl reductase (ER) domain-containing protein n=1 Tax=Actinopolyspora erythraea TaxID=414996 RepID=A0ABR4X3H7_9ACTN|nr:zinc-dependent alcohol dehydrogenase family protein [Actinopolyspora erythraea]KGI81233.1 hypothetical protein IL38_12075 [Actinopolyspora erythraea]